MVQNQGGQNVKVHLSSQRKRGFNIAFPTMNSSFTTLKITLSSVLKVSEPLDTVSDEALASSRIALLVSTDALCRVSDLHSVQWCCQVDKISICAIIRVQC